MGTPFEVFWLFAIPVTLFSWYHIIRHTIHFIPPKEAMPPNPYPTIIFSIAARKLTPILQASVDSIDNSCAAVGFSNYSIKLVVDSADMNIEGVETIVVPKEFTCKSRYKARALHYALRYLPNSRDIWTLHLDEDALVTPQCVSRIVNYIKNGGNPVANGPTVFPYDGNIFTFYAECQRQWTFYWLMDQEMTSAIHWLNGSNLLIRSDIEQSVGWDFINCFISEDARFGYEATKKLGKVFGWHGGLTIESPPSSVNALIKQRKRWFYGSLLNFRYVPKRRIPRRAYAIASWVNGLILTLFFFVLITGVFYEPWFRNPLITNAFSFTAILWIGRYQIGIYQNLKYSSLNRWQKTLFHIGIVPLAPIIDLLCGLPTALTLIKRPRGFEITAKRVQQSETTNIVTPTSNDRES